MRLLARWTKAWFWQYIISSLKGRELQRKKVKGNEFEDLRPQQQEVAEITVDGVEKKIELAAKQAQGWLTDEGDLSKHGTSNRLWFDLSLPKIE